jgi:hypothetical protein
MRLAQIVDEKGKRRVVVTTDGETRIVKGVRTTYALVNDALDEDQSIAEAIEDHGLGKRVDLAAALKDGRVLSPIDHEDPAHLIVTGTGLTHLGSAEGRDKMHKDLAEAEKLTDSMKMFQMGLEGGKPKDGAHGVQPEWFYKGDGSTIAAPGHPLLSPDFALDGGEEPEIVGIYVIGAKGVPARIGFALGNEFSDHVTEKQNYLYLAHSKLRASSFGPEILVGDLPGDIRGTSKILRGPATIWEKPFVSGEENMSHAIENLEAHHFKYPLFCRPGDVHVHYFGTATLSFSDGVKVQPGDAFEISAEAFGLPLNNAVKTVNIAWPKVKIL